MNVGRVLLALALSHVAISAATSEISKRDGGGSGAILVRKRRGDDGATTTTTTSYAEAAERAAREVSGDATGDDDHSPEKGRRHRRRLSSPPRRRLASTAGAMYASYNDGWFSKFRDHDEVVARLTKTCTSTPRHATDCRLTRLPNATSHGADVHALLVGSNAHAGGDGAVGGAAVVGPWVYLMAGQHAREWLPIMAVAYLAERLLEGMATARDIPGVASADLRSLAALLSRVTVVIVPVANPDGFEHTYRRSLAAADELACGVGDAVAG